MATAALRFKESDVARALRGAMKAGLENFTARIERATGDIILQSAGPADMVPRPPADPDAELDQELAAWETKQRR